MSSPRTVFESLSIIDDEPRRFSEKLDEIFRLLHIDCSEGPTSSKSHNDLISPEACFRGNEEWALRWLLNRLSGASEEGTNTRAEPQAWVLLERLLSRVNLATAARLLRQAKFLHLLDHGVGAALEAMQTSKPPIGDCRSGPGTVNQAVTVTTSMSKPMAPADRSARKRKRAGTVEQKAVQANQPASDSHDPHELVAALLEVLEYVVRSAHGMTHSNPVSTDIYAREYMKSLLRTDTAHAAMLLGRWMSLMRIQSSQLSHSSERLEVFGRILENASQIWANRIVGGDDMDGHLSAAAFTEHCLISSLALLEVVPHDGPQKAVSKAVELLLARHLILPARTHLDKMRGPPTPDVASTAPYSAFVSELLKPLHNVAPGMAEEHLQSQTPPYLNLRTRSLVALLRIAVCCSSRRRPSDSPLSQKWLDSFFSVLCEAAGVSLQTCEKDSLGHHQVELLNQMLELSHETKIDLTTKTLQKLFVYHSGLFQENADIQWALLATLLKVNPNSFLLPLDQEARLPHFSIEKTTWADTLLVTTMLALVDSKQRNRRLIRDSVFLPLLLAFAQARNLSAFLRHWHRGLADIESLRRSQGADLTPDQCWEVTLADDMVVLDRLKAILDEALTSGQINALLEEFIALYRMTPKGQGRISDEIVASAIVIDAILQCKLTDSTRDALRGSKRSIWATTCKHLRADDWTGNQNWRLWRILVTLHGEGLERDSKGLVVADEAMAGLNTAAMNIVTDAISMSGHDRAGPEFRESFVAFQFVLLAEMRSGDVPAELFAHLRDALGRRTMQDTKRGYSGRENQESRDFEGWNGNAEDSTSSEKFLLAILATLFICRSQALRSARASVREELLRKIHRLASRGRSLGGPKLLTRTITWTGLWQGILESEQLLSQKYMKDGILETLFPRSVEAESSRMKGLDISTLDDILRMPLASLERGQRETVLDYLLRPRAESLPDSAALCHKEMLLAVRLMQVPNQSSQLATNPSSLFDSATRLARQPILVKQDTLLLFEELIRRTLSHHLTSVSQERSKKYLDEYLEQFYGRLKHSDSFLENASLLVLGKRSLQALEKGTNGSEEELRRKLSKCRLKFLRVLAAGLRSLLDDSGLLQDGTAKRLRFLEAIAVAVEPGQAEIKELKKVVDMLLPYLAESQTRVERRDGEGLSLSPDEARAFYRILHVTNILEAKVIAEGLVSLLIDVKTPDGRVRILNDIARVGRTFDAESRSAALEELEQGNFGRAPRHQQLLVLRSVLRSSQIIPESSPDSKEMLAKIFVRLCRRWATSDDMLHFRAIFGCLETILVKKPWAISQFDVEVLLESIISLGSKSAPDLGVKRAGRIYQSLCKVFGATLAVHRVRLRGRSHLVVQVLQCLLRLLFVPDRESRASKTMEESRPVWLGGRQALGGAEGVAYGRLLTSLCDPSVSAVADTHQRSKQALTPATDRARRMVGQQLPYVLMEYAQCQLHSRLPAGMKEVLLPGLYAIFDAADQATLRMINAGMDASSRSIFKDLYDSYRRFGRWDNDG